MSDRGSADERPQDQRPQNGGASRSNSGRTNSDYNSGSAIGFNIRCICILLYCTKPFLHVCALHDKISVLVKRWMDTELVLLRKRSVTTRILAPLVRQRQS
ncbi:hypothetical protein V9T40_006147 [Parthenolecanium corni]|uniref:Uncharacterized protein n=1 Tax=Parthenolecanium corni TaxID=536013 RepID=A0AAN9TVC6_9HEMI